MDRRKFIQASAGAAAFLAARKRVLGQQGLPLPGSAIPQFVDALPNLHITGATDLVLQMREFLSPVMPTGFVPAAGGTYAGTYVWGYKAAGQPDTSYIGPVILATRGVPTRVTYVNMLGSAPATNVNAWDTSTDQTLHWADPLGSGMNMSNYTGPIPAVPHLHGGEVPPQLDGGPDAWYTSDGIKIGHAYYSMDSPVAKNYAIYRYPNTQEAANIWFHDHVLGITRLNVYAGLAGAYLIKDDALALPPGLTAYGLGTETIIPLVIQDRMFDVNGQLYFPNLGLNPTIHPFWIPEFLGDVIVVNGKAWPFLSLAAKRYRFLFLNGSNARTYEMFLQSALPTAPLLWVIGTDGGYLDAPVPVQKLVMMPGERYDVIIDFAGYQGQNLTLRNTARTPFPKGAPPQGSTIGRIMQFRVGPPPATDTGYNPANPPATPPLRPAMIRLVNPATGGAAVTPQVTRQLTLNEVMGPLGPVEVLVNNTKWDGRSVATDVFPGGIRPDFTLKGSSTEYFSELPFEGQTELWEIVNLTADAHPIHLHLVQFQLMNRQNFNFNKYNTAYSALFPPSSAIDPMTGLPYPGGVFIGGYGPPLNYNTGNPRALGGNPDIIPYLQGSVMPPELYERGWKDTVVAYPGQVTRIMVRWAPTDLLTTTPAAQLHFPFDPNGGHGYVWHCHIIDHEDNEMMRPDSVQPKTGAVRTYIKGTHY